MIGAETDIACDPTSPACPAEDAAIWMMIEMGFLFVWVTEVLLKVLHLTWKGYINDSWNRFDFGIVTFAILDLWLLIITSKAGTFKVLSVLRVLRAARLVRLIRLMKGFKELYLLVSCLVEALDVLCWVALLLGMILYVTGVNLCIILGKQENDRLVYRKDHTQWTREDYWGTVGGTMFSLFQIITGDLWKSGVCDPVVRL